MRLRAKIAWAAGAFLVASAGALVWVAQSDWLRERVRLEVVTEAEKVTGGKVELSGFRWDWHSMTIEADRLVVHGTEPAGTAPLLAVYRVLAQLRIVSFFSQTVAIESITAQAPAAHLIVSPGGATNLPAPKVTGGKPGLQSLLDLKIGRFDVLDGVFQVDADAHSPRRIPWSARGENLAVHLDYDSGGHKYAGTISLDPLQIFSGSLNLSASATLERDRILIANAKIDAGDSELTLSQAQISNLASPVITAEYTGRLTCKSGFFTCPAGSAANIELKGHGRYVSPSDYQSSGSLKGTGSSGKLRNVPFSAVFDAAPGLVALHSIRGTVAGGAIAAEATVRDFNLLAARGNIEHFDLRQTAALETKQPLPYDGRISGPFELTGRLDELRRGRVDVKSKLKIEPSGNGPAARGEVAVHYNGAKSTVDLGDSWLELPYSRVEVSGTLGASLKVKAQSSDFADLLPAIAAFTADQPPAIAFASATFDGSIAGALQNPRITGHASAQDLKFEGQTFEALSGDVALAAETASVRNATLSFGDVRAQGSGSIALNNWKAAPSSALAGSVDLRNADMSKVLTMAGHKELDLTGTVSGSGTISGTLAMPRVSADVTLSHGAVDRQPFDSITGRIQMADRNTQTLTGLFVSGPKRVNISARFAEAGTQFPDGTLEFNLTSNTMPLNQIALVRARQPDIHGFGEFHADGALRIGHDAKHQVQFDLVTMNADASANSLELEGRILGDARFTAQTKDGVLQTHFESNAAQAMIRGEGTVKLQGDYPAIAHVTFSNVGLYAVAALIVKQEDAHNLNFDGEAQGEASLSGPALTPALWTATVEIPKLQLRPLPGSDFAKSLPKFALANDGPLRASLANNQLRIDSAHFKAPETDLTVDGGVAFTADSPLNLRVRGDVNLALARTFDKDLTTSGALNLNATVRGKWNSPDIGGRAILRNAEFRYTDFSNGLTNANAEIAFNGTRATIQSFSAESGGGKVEATGFASLAGGSANFRVEAKAHEVRVRYPEGVSSVSDAALNLSGTLERSEVSGQIMVRRVSINPRSDAATILASTAAPLQAPAARTGITSNMNLDVRIQTAPDVALQTNVAQSLQADASLTLRGTAANPALLGRINITQGEIVFFGNKYAINQGSVSFFNPAKIDPILNIDLETKARGVSVVITVAGPMNGLNVSYRSDPPLQFSDIVALLATGRAPTDPTLAVRDTGQAQGFQQLGASALLGQAIASPVAGRLERFFGVSRLKIDPQLTGVTGSPEARLTIEQQITPEILFTYITDVSSTSTQLIRAEWSFNKNWSAILIREENGYVALDFAYKKRFK